MQALIAGGGRIGYRVAAFLAEKGVAVFVIDEDRSRCDWLSKNVDATVYHGNVLDPAILMEAGIDKADMMITALGNDEITMKLIDFAKSQFGVPKVIAITKGSDSLGRVKERGADSVICSENAVLNQVETLIQANGHKTIYKDRQRDFEIARLSLKATSRLLGKEPAEVEERGTKISAILRGDRLVLPSEDSHLQMGDELFIIGKKNSLAKLIGELEAE